MQLPQHLKYLNIYCIKCLHFTVRDIKSQLLLRHRGTRLWLVQTLTYWFSVSSLVDNRPFENIFAIQEIKLSPTPHHCVTGFSYHQFGPRSRYAAASK